MDPEPEQVHVDHMPKEDFSALRPTDALIANAAVRPRLVALVSAAVLIALGWLALTTSSLSLGLTQGYASLGPGMKGLGNLLDGAGVSAAVYVWLADTGILPLLAALCTPSVDGKVVAADLFIGMAMWSAMAFAMMIPTAAPMLKTYAEIADTAAAKGMQVVSPVVFLGGYIAVWIAFAVVATAVQAIAVKSGLLGNGLMLEGALPAAIVLVVAGLYQFSGLKHACLTKCGAPFQYLFRNWTESAGGVFRLGVDQGLACLGCCWAMMLVMFAAGLMNLVWIAVLAVLMLAEKTINRQAFSWGLGAFFIAWGGVVLVQGLNV